MHWPESYAHINQVNKKPIKFVVGRGRGKKHPLQDFAKLPLSMCGTSSWVKIFFMYVLFHEAGVFVCMYVCMLQYTSLVMHSHHLESYKHINLWNFRKI